MKILFRSFFTFSLISSSVFFILLVNNVQAEDKRAEVSVHLFAHEKIVYEENHQETVVIDGQEYNVPELWLGKKIVSSEALPSSLAPVPSQYVKNNGQIYLHPEACKAFVLMAEKAANDNVYLVIDSGYRSVWYQRKIFQRQLEKGRSFADIARFVAPPGYSEHVLGTAVDFSPSNWRFADTETYQWLRFNAERHGFIETYPKDNPNGEPWEPSHWCYHGPSPLISETME